ncbi:hypothetical protein [Polaribacter sp. R77954]|uniref:hypothetical protein n=1 Tax=Polaribacter sp. R77954 TaxID=3093870 RepID=UPI0037C51977
MNKILIVFLTIIPFASSFSQEKFKDDIRRLNYEQLDSVSRKHIYQDSLNSEIVYKKILKLLNENRLKDTDKPKAYSNLFYWYYSNHKLKKAIAVAKLTNKTAIKIQNTQLECLSLITIELTKIT